MRADRPVNGSVISIRVKAVSYTHLQADDIADANLTGTYSTSLAENGYGEI